MCPTSFACSERTSSKTGTPGQATARSARLAGSISQNATVSKPARSSPRENPPIPEKRSKTLGFNAVAGMIFFMTKPLKHCGFCGSPFAPKTAWQKFCTDRCGNKAAWQVKKAGGLARRHCRQCGTGFDLQSRADANRWHCSPECSVQSARDSRSKFYARNPGKMTEYRATSREKRGPDSNLKRFYARHPDAPRACQSCGEARVLDVAHRPEHRRNGAWRSKANTTLEKVWILCPTCHALLDRMHYPPADLGLR